MFTGGRFHFWILNFFLLLSGCSFRQSSNDPKAMAFKLGTMTLVSYSSSSAVVNITGILPEVGVTDQNILFFYTSADCAGTAIGHGLAGAFSNVGIEVQIPTVSVSKVYAATNTSETCFYLGDFKFSPAKPNPPVLVSTSPASPSRSSFTPALFGTALKNSTLYFYDDLTCTNEVGTGTDSSFSVEGIVANLTANATTSIYGKVVDAINQSSDCALLSQYQHTDIGPDIPTFGQMSPASPNNLSITPTIKGTASADSISVGVYSDSACSKLLAEGTAADFASPGFQISVTKNTLSPLYAKAVDKNGNPSYCAFLTNYLYDNVKPSDPSFFSADPPTPTRLSIYPKIKGHASVDTVTIKFYNSFVCTTPIGSGSKYSFESSGIAAGVTPNYTTEVYAAAFDAAGNSSGCVHMLDYRHNTIPPDQPVFGATDPISPTNKSFTPLISGSASIPTVSLIFFSDQDCINQIGTGSAEQFNTSGIRLTTPNVPDSVNTTTIYAQAIDAEGNISSCNALTSYSYSTKKADTPTFLQSIPNSPSRVSHSPWIIGVAPKTVSIVQIFKDSSCIDFLGSGSRSAFSSMGILVNLPVNNSTNIYAISTDIYGNNSDCTFFANYTHDNLPPLAPSFVASDPVSPTNQSSTPQIQGSVIINDVGKPLPTVAINFYDSPFCLSRLATGSATDFISTGIQVGVPANTSSWIYGQASDVAGNTSTCALMLNYVHDTNPPGQPILDAVTPMTPSYNRNTVMKGTIAASYDIVPALQVSFYRDELCTVALASGSVSQFTGAGIRVVMDENTTTTVYGQTLDIVGNLSSCVHLVDYVHNNLGPKNLQIAQNADGAISLNWVPDMTASPSAKYVVKRALNSGGPYAVLAWQNVGSSYLDYSIKDGEKYYYVVAATNNTGTSLDSAEVTLTSAVSPVETPTTLQAWGGPRLITLQWNGFSSNMFYRILRADQSGGPYTELVANFNGTSYEDKSALNGQSYYYRVLGVNASGESIYSNEASASAIGASSGPTNLTAVMRVDSPCGGSKGVFLSWASSPYFKQFNIKKGASSGSERAFATVSGNSYVDCAPDPNTGSATPLFYTVEATWGSSTNPQTSLPSNEAVIRFALGPDLTVRPGNNEIFVSWASLTNAESYQIWRSEVSGWKNSSYTLINASYAGSTYHDTAVTNGTAYYYVVIANYQFGDEGWPSAEASGIPSPPSLGPKNLTVFKDPQSNGPLLSWSAPSLYNNFFIYSASSLAGPYTLVGSSATNGYAPSLVNNGIYYFYVTSKWGAIESAPTNIVSYVFGYPSTISASQTSTQITLTWSAVLGASSYNILRATSVGGPYAQIANVATSPFSNTTTLPASSPAEADVGYFYVVQPVFSFGVGQYSSEVSGMLVGGSTPSGLTVTASDLSSISLKWAKVSGSLKYSIYKSSTANGTYSLVGATTGNLPNYTVSNLTPSTVYYFKVASNGCGVACQSSSVMGATYSTPAAPTVDAGNNSAEIRWAGVVGATSYNILRSTNNVTFTTIQLGVTGGSFTDSNVTNGNIYFYKMQAVYPSSSILSQASKAVTPGVIPGIPQGLSVVDNSIGTDVSLSWADVPGATSYKLYLSTSSGGPWGTPVLNTSSAAGNAISGLTEGVLYYAVVTALNGTVESGYSSEIYFIPFTQPPAPLPQVIGTSISLTWSSIASASSYDVYRSSDDINYTLIRTGELSPTYTDTTTVLGGIYFYKFLPRTASGIPLAMSAASIPISVVNPPEPKNIIAGASDLSTINISWVASVSPQVVSYRIYRSSTSGGPYSLVDTVISDLTTYQNTGLTPGQDYFYVVTAVNSYGGESIYSNEAGVSLNSGPAALNAIAAANRINLDWSLVPGATGYIVKKGFSSGGPYGIIANLGAVNSYQDNDVKDGVHYFYVVDAVFANNLPSVHSTEVNVAAIVKLNLQVPIEMTDQGLSSENVPKSFLRTQTSFDPNAYDGTITYKFEVVALNYDNNDSAVVIVDSMDNEVGSVAVPAGTQSPRRISGSFTPNGTADIYRLKLAATTSGDMLQVFSARILVNQIGASKTKIYIPMLSSPNLPSLGDLFSPTDSTSSTGYSVLSTSSIFQRDTSKLAQLPNFNAWEFEVLVASEGGTGIVGLYDVTKNSVVEDSEVLFSNTSAKVVKAPINEGVTNFSKAQNELDSYMVAMQCYDKCDLGAVKIYKAGLWVNLTSLTKAEIIFRNAMANFTIDPAANIENERTMVDLSLFSNPVINFQALAAAPAGGSTTVELMSAGSGPGSDAGTGSLSSVSGSVLSFNTSYSQLMKTSSPLLLNSQERFITHVNSSGGLTQLIDSAITVQISK